MRTDAAVREGSGVNFLINADADSGSQYEPSIADLGHGKLIVTWRANCCHLAIDHNQDDPTTGYEL